MKRFAILFAFLIASFTSFSQNGVYLFGFLENGPGTPVDIQIEINTVPVTETILFSEDDGNINTTWIELPGMNWTSIQASFIDCDGNQVTVINNYSPNNLPIDADIYLSYCDEAPLVYGCTDPNAINYNPNADVNDGSCIYPDCEIEIATYYSEPCNQFGFSLYSPNDSIPFTTGVWTINGEVYSDLNSGISFIANTSGIFEVCFEGWSTYCNNGVYVCTAVEVSPDCLETECPELEVDYNANECFAVLELENINPLENVAWFINGEGPIYHAGLWTYQFVEEGVYDICALFEQEGCNTSEFCTTLDVLNCGFQQIFGCTDPNAINYNPEATIDDGSCEYLDCNVEIFTYVNEPCNSYSFSLFAEDSVNFDYGYWTINGESYNEYDPWISFDAPASGDYEVCFEGWYQYCDAPVFACTTIYVSPDCFETECPEVLLDYNVSSCFATLELSNIEPQETVAWFVNGEGPIYNSGLWTYMFEEDGSYEFCALFEQEGCDVYEYCAYIEVWNCGVQQIFGCTDSTALNYNPLANIDDGSCIYENAVNDLCADASPLQIGTQLIDNSNAFINENIWGDCWGFGSGEGEQTSIWFSFTTPSEPASIDIVASYDGSGTLTDTQFGLFSECGGEMIYCDGNSAEGLLSAFHFACGELEENAEYILMVDGWNGDAGSCYLTYNVTTGCDSIIYGCMDSNAINYNPEATIDDGSCQYWEDCWVDITFEPISCDSYVLESFVPNFGSPVDGDWIINGLPYQSNASQITFVATEAGVYDICFESLYLPNCNQTTYSCIAIDVSEDCFETVCPELYAEVDSCTLYLELLNVDPNESVEWFINGEGPSNIAGPWSYPLPEDGTYDICAVYSQLGCDIIEYCIWGQSDDCGTPDIYGCMDPNAINYNPDATIDDGSCQYWEDCLVEIVVDQLDCNSFVFSNFVQNTGWPVDGDWIVNGELMQSNATLFTFQATSPGVYDICFESFFLPNCGQGAFNCISVVVSEDCFETDCPELYAEVDSCILFLELLNVDPNESVEWYINGEGPSSIAGPWNYPLPEDGAYDVCAVYSQPGCDIIEYCIWGQSDDCGTLDVYGCMDSTAVNYNPEATIDDGSCIYGFECNIGFTIGFGNDSNTIAITPDDDILDALEVLWTFGDGTSSNELFPIHQYEGVGPYTLCLNVYYEDDNGSICEATFCVTLTVEMLEAAGIGAEGFLLGVTDITETLGVDNLMDDTEINIYPNPGNEFVNIKITTLQAESFDLSIIDITGQILSQETVNLSNGVGKTTINVSNFATGMYVVSVKNNFGLLNKRFVVSH